MACDITSGFQLGCRDNMGGLKQIYILSGSVSSVTGATNGLLTAISGSGTFYLFELAKNTGDFTETINSSIENGTVYYERVETETLAPQCRRLGFLSLTVSVVNTKSDCYRHAPESYSEHPLAFRRRGRNFCDHTPAISAWGSP